MFPCVHLCLQPSVRLPSSRLELAIPFSSADAHACVKVLIWPYICHDCDGLGSSLSASPLREDELRRSKGTNKTTRNQGPGKSFADSYTRDVAVVLQMIFMEILYFEMKRYVCFVVLQLQ